MLFKSLRLSTRFGKAHGLLLKEKYEQSYKLLVSTLEAGPEDFMLHLIHEDLGIVEYHRGNFLASKKHMDYCLQHAEENPDIWEADEAIERLERINWYYKASERKHSGS